ncbi:Protein synthesis factor, GTP-binding domain protein [Rhodopirellula maiorica SM1]|uniref:Protein synthesis factor, GTP-binding domain protein n=1 Tax=Rhodopirellula maiorica SM1 TaxID=1265738 RepID=M5RTG4_9BACT|nr:Protein synthesis factor, GTP-binding domain protein [Rhodopirellula maiorica SM1]
MASSLRFAIMYETDDRQYAHIDCSGHADYIKNMITKGQVLAKAGSVTPHREFEPEVYVLKKGRGGGTRRSLTVTRLRLFFVLQT